MSDCLFCGIAAKEVESKMAYEDDRIVAFKDLNPVAPVHLLIIPRKHYSTLNDLSEKDEGLAGHINLVAAKLAAENGIAESGYRLVVNCNRDGGQVIPHLHYHLIGGKKLSSAIG